jgi:A/G-specific adenine glycosylase
MTYYRQYGRHDLPWRSTHDPYAILVSEVMLQQTQVDRVVPYFKWWMKKFPTPSSLAHASLSGVLKEWQGLGYNRRAKMLRECAKEIVAEHGGKIPRDFAALVELPGIGPYTAGAIRAFAFDEPEIFIETNIRAALIHHFFPRSKKVPDTRLIPILEKLHLHASSSREWYSALMDYGAHIKKTNPNPSRRSKHHTRQAKFEGSLRQIRGALVRQLIQGSISERALLSINVADSYRIEQALKSLEQDGIIMKKKGRWHLAS